jgi:hypothetical protein
MRDTVFPHSHGRGRRHRPRFWFLATYGIAFLLVPLLLACGGPVKVGNITITKRVYQQEMTLSNSPVLVSAPCLAGEKVIGGGLQIITSNILLHVLLVLQ